MYVKTTQKCLHIRISFIACQDINTDRNGPVPVQKVKEISSLGAVHDGVAAVDGERVPQAVQPLRGPLVPRVDDPTVGLHQDGRAKVPAD